MKRRMLIIMVGSGFAILLIWLLLPRLSWDGAVPREVRLTVRDAAGDPIPAVLIHNGTRRVATTDDHGRAAWTQYFRAGGTDTFMIRFGRWHIDGELVLKTPDKSRRLSFNELVEDQERSVWDRDPVRIIARIQ